MTNAGLRRNHVRFDADYFGDLQFGVTIEVSFAKLKTSGLWTCWDDGTFSIQVNAKLRMFPWAVNLVLLHEMIHMYCHLRGWHDHVKHGPSFRAERRRLKNVGAFDSYL